MHFVRFCFFFRSILVLFLEMKWNKWMDESKSFSQLVISIFIFCRYFFKRFWPVEKCGVTPHCLYRDLFINFKDTNYCDINYCGFCLLYRKKFSREEMFADFADGLSIRENQFPQIKKIPWSAKKNFFPSDSQKIQKIFLNDSVWCQTIIFEYSI